MDRNQEIMKQQRVSWKKCFWGAFIYFDLTGNQAELNGQSAPG
jgi:hypothetical protein